MLSFRLLFGIFNNFNFNYFTRYWDIVKKRDDEGVMN